MEEKKGWTNIYIYRRSFEQNKNATVLKNASREKANFKYTLTLRRNFLWANALHVLDLYHFFCLNILKFFRWPNNFVPSPVGGRRLIISWSKYHKMGLSAWISWYPSWNGWRTPWMVVLESKVYEVQLDLIQLLWRPTLTHETLYKWEQDTLM